MAGFQFVVFGDEQPGTRRAIRSHVMKGKNAGRKLPPRQRKTDNVVDGQVAVTATTTTTKLNRGGDGSKSSSNHVLAARCRGSREQVGDKSSKKSSGQTATLAVNGPHEIQEQQQYMPFIGAAHLGELTRAVAIPRAVGHELSWRPFPDDFTAASIDMLRSFFSPLTGTSKVIPFCRPKDRYDSFFWRFSIADEAFMHAMVATISALQQDSLSRTERSSPRLTLSHVSRGLHLINKQLEFASSAGGSGESGQHKATEKQGDAVAVSDATIASILVLSMYERLRGDYARAAVHLRGLRHIVVDLRGGVADLRHTRGLASKICRADIDLALHFGTGTVFTAAEALPAMQLQQEQGGGEMSSSFPTAMPGPRLPRMEEENVDCYGVTAQLSPRYSELMRDLLRTTALLNSTAGAPVLDVYGLEALLVNLCYRIVELRPLRQSNAEATSSCRSGSKSASSSTNDVGTPHENYIDDRNTSFANNAGQPHMNNTASTTFSTAAATAASATGSGSSTVNTVSNIDDACHLGMAAFMTTLMLEFGGAQLVTHERLRASLGASIRRLSSSGVQSLRAALWLCFVGGVSVFKTGKMTTTTIRGLKASAVTSRQYGESRSIADSQNRSSRKYKNSGGHEEDGASDNDKSDVDDGVDDDTAWLLAQIHELSQDLGLDCPSPFGSPVSSWPSVLSVLSEFPWVHSLHDKPGQAIWDATCAMAAAAAAVAEAAVYSDAEADDQFLLRDDAPAGAGYAVDMLPCRGQVSLKLRPLQTLTHEPGVSLSHVKHGLW